MARAPTPKRYAQALFQIAREHGTEEAWLEGLRQAQQSLSEPPVSIYLAAPQVRLDQKDSVIQQVMAGLDTLPSNMVRLLASRHSLALLPKVVLAYEALLDELRGRVRVQATSAVAVDRGRRDRLQELLKGALEREVVLSVGEDPAIIGGLIVRIGDRVIDGSTSARLEALGRRLTAGAPV